MAGRAMEPRDALCKHWAAGHCSWGQLCRFRHSQEQAGIQKVLQTPPCVDLDVKDTPKHLADPEGKEVTTAAAAPSRGATAMDHTAALHLLPEPSGAEFRKILTPSAYDEFGGRCVGEIDLDSDDAEDLNSKRMQEVLDDAAAW